MPVAAAVEVFMVALDVLDDAEDGEDTPLGRTLGAPCTLNISTGLLFLAHHGLLRAESGALAASILLEAGLRACSGQHADLAPAPEQPCGLDEALAITAGKSGSLGAVACHLGAVAAGANAPTQDLYARFGWYLGMAAQLANDLAAIRPDATGKTDIALRRPTLPLTYAALLASSTDGPAHNPDVQTVLWTGGPAHFTWAVAETYRLRALALIPHLTVDPAGRADLAGLLSSP